MNLLVALLAVSFLPFFEAKNQVANFVITPPHDGESVTPELPNLEVKETCQQCGGKGLLVLEEPDYGQSAGRIGKATKTRKQECQLCGGKGKIRAFMNPKALMQQVSIDYAAFAVNHQNAGDMAVGEAFVPRAVYGEIDKTQRKLVEDAFGHPCKKCNWTGLEPCKKCKGTGLIPCTEKADCKSGWLVVHDKGSRRNSKVNVSLCPVCGGAKSLTCPECGGRRMLSCSKCNGSGIKKKGSL